MIGRWMWLVALVACHGRRAAHDDAPMVPRDAAIDAVPCPGKPEACAACGSGNGSACDQIAFEHQPPESELYWYQRACALGDLTGCQGVTSVYVIHGTHEDFLRAQAHEREVGRAKVDAERTRCAAGDDQACYSAAASLDVGLYVEKDHAAAVALLDPMCTAGKADACLELATLDVSPADKARYSKRGCSLGDARVCGDMLGLFDDTPLAPHDGTFARAQLSRGCVAREPYSCWVLGGLLVTGKGGVKDRVRGVALVGAACKLDAQFCDVRDRLAKGGGFFDPALDNMPMLDLRPLIDAAKSGTPHRP